MGEILVSLRDWQDVADCCQVIGRLHSGQVCVWRWRSRLTLVCPRCPNMIAAAEAKRDVAITLPDVLPTGVVEAGTDSQRRLLRLLHLAYSSDMD